MAVRKVRKQTKHGIEPTATRYTCEIHEEKRQPKTGTKNVGLANKGNGERKYRFGRMVHRAQRASSTQAEHKRRDCNSGLKTMMSNGFCPANTTGAAGH